MAAHYTNSTAADFQTTLLGTGTYVAGDTIWLRVGTYFPPNQNAQLNGSNAPVGGGYGWSLSISGTAENPIVIRGYPGEIVKIDRPWRFGSYGYLRFQDLWFFDSLKGFDPGIDFPPPPRPWPLFDDAVSPGNEWVNCVIHKANGVWYGNTAGRLVRGCILWDIGAVYLNHVIYPACENFIGNISGWVSGGTFNLGSESGSNIRSNIAWGAGAANGIPTKEFNVAYGGTFAGNVVVETAGSSVLYGGPPIIHGNKFVATFAVSLHGNQPVVLTNNSFYQHDSGTAWPSLGLLDDSADMWTVNGNEYYSANAVRFAATNMNRTFAEWKSDYPGLDTTSTSADTTAPPDSVTIFPNADAPKRAHIAIFNWSGAHNVDVSLSGVLSTGDSYQLISAQNYGAGAIRSGTYNGIGISVPMTNLSVATIHYGTHTSTNSATVSVSPTSPDFAAFVVIGSSGSASVQFTGNVKLNGNVVLQ